uniref:Uncharacterized protein n=1 Tax=Leersia perrieri TaxID=77586 RepID=A0A0D9WAM4_9ORYZ
MDQKLLCLVFVSVLLLANLAYASSSSPSSSLSRQKGQVTQVLGRRGRELTVYRHEAGKQKEQHEVVAMEVRTKKTAAETKAGWVNEDEGAREGLIDSADYSGVVMHSPSPPKHRHPKKP